MAEAKITITCTPDEHRLIRDAVEHYQKHVHLEAVSKGKTPPKQRSEYRAVDVKAQALYAKL